MGAPVPGSDDDLFAAALTQELTAMRPRPRALVAVDAKGRELPIALVTGRGRWIQGGRKIVELLRSGTARVDARNENGELLKSWAEEDLPAPEPSDDAAAAAPVARAGLLNDEDLRRLEFIAQIEDRSAMRMQKFMTPILSQYQTLSQTLATRVERLEGNLTSIVDRLVKAQVSKGQLAVENLQLQLAVLEERRASAAAEGQEEDPADARRMWMLEQILARLGVKLPRPRVDDDEDEDATETDGEEAGNGADHDDDGDDAQEEH